MTYHSKYNQKSFLEVLLNDLSKGSSYSTQDGCAVCEVVCSGCGVTYEEEYDFATASAISGVPFECLKCTGASADEPVPRITVKGVMASGLI